MTEHLRYEALCDLIENYYNPTETHGMVEFTAQAQDLATRLSEAFRRWMKMQSPDQVVQETHAAFEAWLVDKFSLSGPQESITTGVHQFSKDADAFFDEYEHHVRQKYEGRHKCPLPYSPKYVVTQEIGGIENLSIDNLYTVMFQAQNTFELWEMFAYLNNNRPDLSEMIHMYHRDLLDEMNWNTNQRPRMGGVRP